jgi:hypothetical protein
VSAPAPGASNKRRRRESCGPDTRVGWVHTSSTEVGRQTGAGNSGRGGHGYSRERRPARGGGTTKGVAIAGTPAPEVATAATPALMMVTAETQAITKEPVGATSHPQNLKKKGGGGNGGR